MLNNTMLMEKTGLFMVNRIAQLCLPDRPCLLKEIKYLNMKLMSPTKYSLNLN